ncbi:MAG: hybrid sensor histidine kinase/response regulator [Cyanobacteria bacterium P01_G01_bin.19]
MNSQDKPLEANDNLEESLDNSDSNIQGNNDSTDLWMEAENPESVTEFINAEDANFNADNVDSSENSTPYTSQEPPKKKELTELDFDNWDFRDALSINAQEETSNSSSESTDHDLANHDEVSSNEDSSDLSDLDELGEFETLVAQTEDSPENNDLEQLSLDGLDKDNSDLGELGESEDLVAQAEASFENNKLESLGLDGLGEDNSDLSDLDELSEFETLVAQTEDSPENNDLEQLGLNDLGSSDLSLDELGEFQDLVAQTEDSSENNELETLGLDSSGMDLDGLEGELDSLTVEALDSLDSNDLDNLLDLDSDTYSLDSLILESDADLGDLEDALSSGSELPGLDSLLQENASASSTAMSTPATATSSRSTAKKAAPPPAKAQGFDQTMRVSVRKLDDLNNLIGELVVKRNRLEDDQERLRRFLDNLLGHVQSLGEAGAKMHDMYERSLLEGALIASRQSRANSAVAAGRNSGFGGEEPKEEGLDALEMDRFNGFHLLSQDIIELIVRVREAASDIQFVVDETDKVAQTFRQVTSQLQDGMNSSRMVAFGQTADRLPRAIRDISRKQKKQTKLHVEGKDVLIDKMIVEHLYNPMTHLVNNAISHGIETPEKRISLGKPEAGNINIRAFLQGNQTVITVTDDGAGIDPERVKAKAIEKNLITWATAQQLSDQQVYELLFHPGFSTKDEADDFAGRGVGMDVVNTDLKKIRGSVSTESEVGKGTTFTIRLPLVLSICKALTCVDNNSKIAFPIDGVEDTKEYLPSDIQTNNNGVRCISWKNTLLPLRPLNGLLNYNRQIRRAGIYNANQNNDDTISVIILRSLDNLLAVEVDEVRAEQEIVIKQIDGPIPKPAGIAGATVLGDGTIMPIGDVLELIEIAQGKRTIEIGFDIINGQMGAKPVQTETIQQEPMVLVVDDSITVRELLSMSFNKLGYRVEQARDGQEAWDKLRGGLECDMIFSDIEMPRMNGLELLSNLHKDSKLKSIPVAMLTSRGADKHKQIANDLGAKAYLTKPYTEKDLMDVAQHLIDINRANKEAESATVNLNRVQKRNSGSEAEVSTAPMVLIIDDSVTVRELLSMTFKKAGYRVEKARDGQEAWEKLNDGLECDIAFCDIEMPRMNGLELLSQLQKNEKLAKMPIAMLTSRGAKKMRNIAASRGANGYFVKPYVEEDLLKAAEKMMNGEMLIETE